MQTATVQSEGNYCSMEISTVQSNELFHSIPTSPASSELQNSTQKGTIQSEEVFCSIRAAAVQSEEPCKCMAGTVQSDEPYDVKRNGNIQSEALCQLTACDCRLDDDVIAYMVDVEGDLNNSLFKTGKWMGTMLTLCKSEDCNKQTLTFDNIHMYHLFNIAYTKLKQKIIVIDILSLRGS